MKMKADIEMKKLESDKRVMELIRLGKTQGGFVALSQIEEKFPEAMRTEKGLDHVTELLGRSLISIGQEEEEDIDTQESTYYDEDLYERYREGAATRCRGRDKACKAGFSRR